MTEFGSSSRVYVAGHTGMVGSTLVRRLLREGFEDVLVRNRVELDLSDRTAVDAFLERESPEYVLLAAAKVGGILANSSYPGDFIRENLLIQTNVIDAARRFGARKLLFLGSSCIYPKHADQPIRENALLSGLLEPTNDAYAVAKIAGITMCQAYRRQYGCNFISAMPTNLYGPGDNFDLHTSHVLPALIRKFHEAKLAGRPSVSVWGSGQPRREFLHVDDLADACVFLMREWDSPDIVNVGVGKDISIGDLAEVVRGIVGFGGAIEFDRTKPDGAPRKLLDVSRLSEAGWEASIGLEQGILGTYEWFLDNGVIGP